MFITLYRLFKTAREHVLRNGWLSVASTAIMILTFFVTSVFFIAAYTSNAVLTFFEKQYQIVVFFDPQKADMAYVDHIKKVLMDTGQVQEIHYVSQQEALKRYKSLLSKDNPVLTEGLSANILPQSLEIKAVSFDDLDSIANTLYTYQTKDNNKIDKVLYFKDVVTTLTQFTKIIRIIGIVLIAFLASVSFVIVLITIGITINSHATEIEIMQLVGASRNYIRIPYILDGAFYGGVGALLSVGLIYLILFVILHYNDNLLNNVTLFFRTIPLPHFDALSIIVAIAVETLLGMILGAFGSIIALRRYLK